MPGALERDPKLILITELCRELAAFGFSVGLSDAAPAAVVQTRSARSLYVTVDDSREFFEWCDARERHAVGDPRGAVARLAEYVEPASAGRR